jgi:hypothetical protein
MRIETQGLKNKVDKTQGLKMCLSQRNITKDTKGGSQKKKKEKKELVYEGNGRIVSIYLSKRHRFPNIPNSLPARKPFPRI